jgi:hypothetical protein
MNARRDGLNVTGTEAQRTAAWLSLYSVTLESLRKAQALEGLGVSDGTARNDVDVALGRLGLIEHYCPVSLRADPQIVETFEDLNAFAFKRTGRSLVSLRSYGLD